MIKRRKIPKNCYRALADKIAQHTGPPLGPTGCQLWTLGVNGADGHGYPRMRWGDYTFYVARVVLTIKLGRPVKQGMDTCHARTCISRSCIKRSHLREGSHKENINDAVILGRMNGAKGERNCNAVLTTAKVRAIKKKLRNGSTQASLGIQYKVHPSIISSISRNKTWKEVN